MSRLKEIDYSRTQLEFQEFQTRHGLRSSILVEYGIEKVNQV